MNLEKRSRYIYPNIKCNNCIKIVSSSDFTKGSENTKFCHILTAAYAGKLVLGLKIAQVLCFSHFHYIIIIIIYNIENFVL